MKFYDLNKEPVVCPGCGFTIAAKEDPPTKAAPKAKPSSKKEEDTDAPETGDDFNDDEAGVIDDDNDLADLSDEDVKLGKDEKTSADETATTEGGDEQSDQEVPEKD